MCNFFLFLFAPNYFLFCVTRFCSRYVVGIASLCVHKLEQSVGLYVLNWLLIGRRLVFFSPFRQQHMQRTGINRLPSTNGRPLTYTDHRVFFSFFLFFTIDDKRVNLYVCCYNLSTSCAVVIVGV